MQILDSVLVDTRRGRTSRRPGRAGHGFGWRQILALAIMQGERILESFLHGDSRHETDEFRCSGREDELVDDTTEDVLEEILLHKNQTKTHQPLSTWGEIFRKIVRKERGSFYSPLEVAQARQTFARTALPRILVVLGTPIHVEHTGMTSLHEGFDA